MSAQTWERSDLEVQMSPQDLGTDKSLMFFAYSNLNVGK